VRTGRAHANQWLAVCVAQIIGRLGAIRAELDFAIAEISSMPVIVRPVAAPKTGRFPPQAIPERGFDWLLHKGRL
jgi:hypothetical protein